MAGIKDFLETEEGLLATNPDYIQWYLASPDEINRLAIAMQNYKNQKNDNLGAVAIEQYNKLIKRRFHENDDQIEAFTNLAKTFVGNEDFQKKIQDAIDKMPMPSISNRSIFTQDDLLKSSNEYQNLINEIREAMTAIISTLGVSNLDALAPDDDDGSYNTKKILDNVKELYSENYKEFDRIIKIKDYEKLDKTFRGNYRRLLNKIPDFFELANKTTGEESDKVIISKILATIQILVGITTEIKTEIELQEIIKDLERELSKYKNITITRSGDKGDDVYKIGTADLSISLSPKDGQIDFKMPNLGITQKRTSAKISSNTALNIHLKSSNYGKILKDVDQNLLTAFYTIYVNAAPIMPYGIKQQSLPAGLLVDSYNHMKSLAFVTALIGNIDAKDLVCIIVINEKSYTIFDFLERIKNKIDEGNENIFSIKPSFSTKHKGLVDEHKGIYNSLLEGNINKNRFVRSKKIRAAIEKIPVSCALKIQTSTLR